MQVQVEEIGAGEPSVRRDEAGASSSSQSETKVVEINTFKLNEDLGMMAETRIYTDKISTYIKHE